MIHSLPKIPMTICEAIAREEGFYVQGTRSCRNNNPGDLEFHPWMTSYGASKGDPRFAIFNSPLQGFAALRHLLETHYKGKTIFELIQAFAPSTENNTFIYIQNICIWTGLTATTVIDEYL